MVQPILMLDPQKVGSRGECNSVTASLSLSFTRVSQRILLSNQHTVVQMTLKCTRTLKYIPPFGNVIKTW